MATFPTVTDDDGTGTTGTILNASLFTDVKNYINAGMTAVTYAGGNFTASSGSWTVDAGDQTTFAYAEIGKIMIVTFDIQTSSVSATPGNLAIAIPNGRTAARAMSAGTFAYNENGSAGVGPASVSGTSISLFKTLAGTAWSASTNTTRVQGTISFEIV